MSSTESPSQKATREKEEEEIRAYWRKQNEKFYRNKKGKKDFEHSLVSKTPGVTTSLLSSSGIKMEEGVHQFDDGHKKKRYYIEVTKNGEVKLHMPGVGHSDASIREAFGRLLESATIGRGQAQVKLMGDSDLTSPQLMMLCQEAHKRGIPLNITNFESHILDHYPERLAEFQKIAEGLKKNAATLEVITSGTTIPFKELQDEVAASQSQSLDQRFRGLANAAARETALQTQLTSGADNAENLTRIEEELKKIESELKIVQGHTTTLDGHQKAFNDLITDPAAAIKNTDIPELKSSWGRAKDWVKHLVGKKDKLIHNPLEILTSLEASQPANATARLNLTNALDDKVKDLQSRQTAALSALNGLPAGATAADQAKKTSLVSQITDGTKGLSTKLGEQSTKITNIRTAEVGLTLLAIQTAKNTEEARQTKQGLMK